MPRRSIVWRATLLKYILSVQLRSSAHIALESESPASCEIVSSIGCFGKLAGRPETAHLVMTPLLQRRSAHPLKTA